MHGTLFQSRCVKCNQPFSDAAVYEDLASLPRCAVCGAAVRPHIVWFGEMPLEMDDIYRRLSSATAILVVGTSGSVYPAAGLVDIARRRGIRTMYVGPEEPNNVSSFDEILLGPATEVLPALL